MGRKKTARAGRGTNHDSNNPTRLNRLHALHLPAPVSSEPLTINGTYLLYRIISDLKVILRFILLSDRKLELFNKNSENI